MNFLTDFIKPVKLKLALYYFSLLLYVATVFFLPVFIGRVYKCLYFYELTERKILGFSDGSVHCGICFFFN